MIVNQFESSNFKLSFINKYSQIEMLQAYKSLP